MYNEPTENQKFDDSSNLLANPNDYSFLKSLKLSEDVIRRLSIHLDGLAKGSDEIYLTPIGKSMSPDLILDGLDKIYDLGKSKINETLSSIEAQNREKYGPRSIAKPWAKRINSLEAYFNKKSDTSPSVKYNIGNLRPLSLSNGVLKLKNNTNSGLPYYTRKSRIKDRVSGDYDDLLSQNYPCILFTRTQEGNKTRNVWGYPIADTLREALFYFPVLDYQKSMSWRTALAGPEEVDRAVTKLVKNAKSSDKLLLSVDFSSYDASVNSELIRQAFKYISSLYQKSYGDEIRTICERFINIGVVTPSGVITGVHGVPSGSTFTNEVDSIIQYIISKSVGVSDSDIQIQGDDGVYSLNERDSVKLKKAFQHYGLNLNDEKSHSSKDYCVYLQKLYHVDYMLDDGLIGGIYSIYRALNRIVYQERYSNFEDFGLKGVDYYSLRTITILENCKYHPLFKELVNYVRNLDKYKLNYSNESINNYNRMIKDGSGVGDLFKNQYGEEIRGVNSFETVKILKKGG